MNEAPAESNQSYSNHFDELNSNQNTAEPEEKEWPLDSATFQPADSADQYMKNKEIQLHCNHKESSIPQTDARQPSFEIATP